MPGFDYINPEIRIVHVSDLHMTEDPIENFNISRFISELIKDIKEYKPHLLLFTGDISNSGRKEEFDQVEYNFLGEIMIDKYLSEDTIVLTPGNHDISWESLGLLNSSILDNINSSNEVISFFQNKSIISAINQTRENYLNFSKKYRETVSTIYSDDFVTIKRFDFGADKENKVINIATLSSNVRCRISNKHDRSHVDHGQLIIGKHQIDNLKKNLKDSDINILLTHHPLNYIIDWEQSLVKNFINNSFHLHFYGHMHDFNLEKTLGQTGHLISVQTSSLYSSYESIKNCYSTIKWEINSNKLFFSFKTYNEALLKWDTEPYSSSISVKKIDSKNSIDKTSLNINDYTLKVLSTIEKELKEAKLELKLLKNLIQTSFLAHPNYFLKDYEKLPISLDKDIYILVSKHTNEIEILRVKNCRNIDRLKLLAWNDVIFNYRKLTYFAYRRDIKKMKLQQKELQIILKEHEQLRKSITNFFQDYEGINIKTSELTLIQDIYFQIRKSLQNTEHAMDIYQNRRILDQDNYNSQIVLGLESSLTELHKIIMNFFPGDSLNESINK